LLNSQEQNTDYYIDFDSEAAIEQSFKIIDEYWDDYNNQVSRYVGKVWFEEISKQQYLGNVSWHDDYIEELVHCNLQNMVIDDMSYCILLLKTGMGQQDFANFVEYYYAFSSSDSFTVYDVGYLLVNRFGWKAYAFISPEAKDFSYYLNSFKYKKEYPIQNQPSIKIEKYYTLGEDDNEIEIFLSNYDFGFGFSENGIHNWITNYNDLLECHSNGSPSKKYHLEITLPNLFETTPLIEYDDHDVHILFIPPNE